MQATPLDAARAPPTHTLWTYNDVVNARISALPVLQGAQDARHEASRRNLYAAQRADISQYYSSQQPFDAMESVGETYATQQSRGLPRYALRSEVLPAPELPRAPHSRSFEELDKSFTFNHTVKPDPKMHYAAMRLCGTLAPAQEEALAPPPLRAQTTPLEAQTTPLEAQPTPSAQKKPHLLVSVRRAVMGAAYDAAHWSQLPRKGFVDTARFVLTRDGRATHLVLAFALLILTVALLSGTVHLCSKLRYRLNHPQYHAP